MTDGRTQRAESSEDDLPVTVADIEQAATRIAPWVHRTPLVSSALLAGRAGCDLWLKAENLQKVGAFKARGAHNAVFALSDAEAARGVITHSSGNHAAAVALAARNRGIVARVVMPENAPSVKREAVAGYGAEITLCPPTLEARESTVDRIRAEHGSTMIHPYDDAFVVAGQGTVGLEIVEQTGAAGGGRPADAVVVPVGGGGLLAGVALAVTSRWPHCRVIAAEPEGADDAHRSFHAGHIVPQTDPDTVADGLLTSLGQINFAIMSRLVDDVLLVDDAQIMEAMELLWTRAKLVVEPSGAVSLAAVLSHGGEFAGQRVVAVISGGNVDVRGLRWT